MVLIIIAVVFLQIPWGTDHRTAVGVPRSFAPHGDEVRGEDGLVDYLATINGRLAEGVNPDDNAVVDYFTVWGIGLNEPEWINEFCNRLGIEVPVANEFGVLRTTWEAVDKTPAGSANLGAGESVADEGETSGWFTKNWADSDAYPEIAKWLEAHRSELERIRAATRKPRYYHPWVTPDNTNPDSPTLIAVLLPLVQELRELSRVLVADALRELARNDVQAAIDDALAIRRLAQQECQSATIIERLVAAAVGRMSHELIAKIMDRDDVTDKQLELIAAALQEQPGEMQIADMIDRGERYFGLDVLQQVDRGKLDLQRFSMQVGAGETSIPIGPTLSFVNGLIDWGTATETINRRYDEIVAAIRVVENGEARESLSELENQLAAGGESNWRTTFATIVSPVARGRKQGDSLISMLSPALSITVTSLTRHRTANDLLRVAVAAKRYRLATGSWPKQIADVVPKYLDAVPRDRFDGQPLRFEVSDQGVTIASEGQPKSVVRPTAETSFPEQLRIQIK